MHASVLWVAVLHISDATAEKIAGRHGLEPDWIREQVLCRSGLRYVWSDDPDRGLRAIVELPMDTGRILVVLYPATGISSQDEYHLGSAYPVA